MSKIAKNIVQNLNAVAAGQVPDADSHLKRYPFVLLVDTSGSVGSAPAGGQPDIVAINDALPQIFKALRQPKAGTPLAKIAKQIDLTVIAYNSSVTEVLPWTVASKLPTSIAPLSTKDLTHTGAALDHAFRAVHQRQTELRAKKTPIGMPNVIHITDGAPTDMKPGDGKWTEIQARLARIAGTQGVETIRTAAVMHWLTPNGCKPDAAGQSGLDCLSLLSGAASVHPIEEGIKMVDALVELVTATIISLSVMNMSAADAGKAATARLKELRSDKTEIN